MEELPIAAESTEVPDSPCKDANSIPSTDDESAYHDEAEGVEIDDSSFPPLNDDDRAKPKEDTPNVNPVKNTEVVQQKKESKKKKRLSSILFAKKAKKSSARAAPTAADEVPGLVLTMADDNVSSLTVPRVDKTLNPGKIEGGKNTDIGRGGSAAASNEKDVEISNSVHLANAVPMRDLSKRAKRKSLRLFSKKDNKTKEQLAAPHVVTPPLSPPSTINVKTQAPSMPVVEDDLSDAAVGIGRKWALFFHQEKGEIDEDSDDASQEDDVISFAGSASDLSAVGLDRASSPVAAKEAGNLEVDCSAEARKDDSKTRVLRETALGTPEASEEPISLHEQPISTETKENSSTVEAPEVASIREAGEGPLPEETLAEVLTAGEAEPHEPTAATSPSSPKRKTWGLLPNRNNPAVINIESDTVSTKNMATISASMDVTTKADTSVEKETSNESATKKNLSSSNASEECSVFSGVDDDDQDLEKAEDSGTKESIHSEEPKQVEDDASKSGEERSKEDHSDSGGIFASVIAAFMTSVLINDTGDVEVAADPAGSTEDCETAVVNMKITGDHQKEASPGSALSESLTDKEGFSDSEAMETIDMTDETATPENNARSEDNNESVAGGNRTGESPISPISTCVIAQRKTHLAALGASISTLDAESKEKDSSRIISTDTVSKERSQRVLDSSLIDEDSVDLNHFPKQLDDDESAGGETVETELIDSGVCANCISARTRCTYPPTCRFDDREFDEGFELMVCGAAVPTCQGMNVQYETEAKLASCVANFDLENFNALVPCGRSSDTVEDESVHPGSEVAPPEAPLSSNGSMGSIPDEVGIHAMKFLDEFYEETSLDESFWSALDDRTVQSTSDRSGSIRKFRKLLDDCDGSDLEDSIFDTVAERDDEDTVESIGHEVVAEPSHVVPSSPDEDIEGTESLLDNSSPANDDSKDNANATVKEIEENTCVEKDDALEGSKQSKAGSKSSDKAVKDIKKAMSTLKKYASRYGISEPELLWRIQKERKKRKGWSASMAEF